MAEPQDSMTPEEKLLNVIQSGGNTAASSEKPVEPAAPPAAEASGSPVSEPQKKAEKPVSAPKVRPSVKRAVPAGSGGAVSDKPTGVPKPRIVKSEEQDKASVPEITSLPEQPVVLKKKEAAAGSGIRTVNRMLAAGILVILGLSGLETFNAVKARGVPVKTNPMQIPAVGEYLPDVTEVQKLFEKDIWWRPEDAAAGEGQSLTQTITVSTTPWQEYMKKNMKLMGVSLKEDRASSEAIIVDSGGNKMVFVRLGNTFLVEGVEVRLDDLEHDRARFSDGKSSVELK